MKFYSIVGFCSFENRTDCLWVPGSWLAESSSMLENQFSTCWCFACFQFMLEDFLEKLWICWFNWSVVVCRPTDDELLDHLFLKSLRFLLCLCWSSGIHLVSCDVSDERNDSWFLPLSWSNFQNVKLLQFCLVVYLMWQLLSGFLLQIECWNLHHFNQLMIL